MKRSLNVMVWLFTATVALAQVQGVPPAGYRQGIEGQPPPPPPQVQVAPAEGDAAIFYETLKPHGTWVQVEPFGPVWRPAVAVQDSTWRPYHTGGQWVWANNAWYWQSEYAWGASTFHYGRWVLSRHLGWVWVPGRVWAPAWVVWKNTDTHIGWAPMPPEHSVTIQVGGSSGGGFSWGFQFSIGDDHYVYAPLQTFSQVIVVRSVDYDYHSHWYHEYDREPEHHYGDHHYEQPSVARIPEPSRRTTMMQQVVTRPAQVASQPPRATSTQAASSSRKNDTSSSDRRSSRLRDIATRARR